MQKSIAKRVLSKIKTLDHRAIIAGGAARDWYFGNVANDIDIFYYHNNDLKGNANIKSQTEILKVLLGVDEIKVLGFSGEKSPGIEYHNYLLNPNIVGVFECCIEGVIFQFIQLTKRNVDVSKFAYNMCQAWTNCDTIWTTMKFILGVEKKILIETGELYANCDRFKMKMVAKFPDYSYISRD